MKTSIIALAALVSGAVAIDKPHFLNSDINPEEGTPFTFKYDNCPDGCTIILQSGSDQKNLQTITSSATGSSFTWTPSNIPSGTYNFYIQNNSDKSLNNYSAKFQYQGTATSTASASSTPSSTSGSSSSTAASSSSASSTASSSSSASTTKSHSSTSTAAASSSATKSAAAATTTAPGNAGNAVSFSPIALIGGAVAAMLFLN